MLVSLPAYRSPSGIAAQAYTVSSEEITLPWAISVVKFKGALADGSAGRDNAEFVKLASLEAMARQDAKCIVMDFTDCVYRWGNSLEAAFDAIRRLYHYEWHDIGMFPPVKVVASDRSAGLRSLLPREMVFDEVESAVRSCSADLEKWNAG